MPPAEPTRVWRKTRRRALRGVPTGPRATRAERLWREARAEMEADFAARTPGAVA